MMASFLISTRSIIGKYNNTQKRLKLLLRLYTHSLVIFDRFDADNACCFVISLGCRLKLCFLQHRRARLKLSIPTLYDSLRYHCQDSVIVFIFVYKELGGKKRGILATFKGALFHRRKSGHLLPCMPADLR